ncbi:hypothetical protein CISIN_1g035555mg [Citrus sinensis]|uniref:Uncharacterized protein n=2 Tax=Citrus sinensis TaxID=2711 RepID=A0A067D837_CITSI|nr:hypothetical protein CISIN_1g035555mg [Citrus sinensis]
MEDVLDEWSTARLKLKINGVDALVCLEKVCSFFPAASCFGCNPLVLCRDIALKVREINESLDDIAKQKDQFGFAVNVIKSNERADERVPSISSIDESEIFGREKEKSELVNRLLCESSKEQKGPCVISLVGMGGIGKTTLAQFAYNNDDVKKILRKEYGIARAIIEALTYSSSNFVEFQSLMQHIQKHVAGKKLLLVLDDVWNEDFYKWEQFYNCLKTCLHGSKILITTRKETVARIMGSADIISVNVLSETECWLVFESLGFSGKSMEERENLEKIGREIIRKCKGLPLVAKTIASLLRSKNTEKEWQNILESEIWEIEEVEKNLLAPLLLSYNELPSKVKQCFTYCAIFPKNSKIWKDKLIELWMAQGFLNNKRSKEMEEIGEEYFNILASRSFFQDFERGYDGKIYQCKVHDIVHDFAQFLCRKECLMVEILCGEEALKLIKCRRWRCDNYIKEIPTNIEKLIHLKYLNLSSQKKIKRLPETLCELYNLECLAISFCTNLRQLPQGIGKLRKLMYLDNDYTNSLRYLPVGIRELIRLRRVRKFVVGGGYDRACSLESLKRLILLRECRIHGLGDVSDVGEARRAELEKKKNLFDLELRFDCNVIPKNWIMSLTNLRYLSLSLFKNCEQLLPLGKLQSLEYLQIGGMHGVKRVGNEFLGVESDTNGSSVIAFPKLRELKFSYMEELEEWDFGTATKGEIIIMPRLSCLIIFGCFKLKALPDLLLQKTTLQKLHIWGGCPIFRERYREETGEDWPKIRHIPNIEIE